MKFEVGKYYKSRRDIIKIVGFSPKKRNMRYTKPLSIYPDLIFSSSYYKWFQRQYEEIEPKTVYLQKEMKDWLG